MSDYRLRVEGKDYLVLDADCCARPCLSLGVYSPKAKSARGQRCCVRREHHGCPDPPPQPTTRRTS
jgi:hypothetical protein